MNLKKFTRRQIFLFCFINAVRFLADMVYSLQAPLLPMEAQSKGANAIQFGVVMGIYEITNIMLSPVVVKFCTLVGVKTTFAVSVVVISLSTVAFGCIKFIPTVVPFITVGCILRIFEATGWSGIAVTSNTVVANEFKENRAIAIGIIESSTNIALAIGPFAATLLFEVGGFLLPFACVGIAIILVGFLAMLYLPQNITDLENKESNKPGYTSYLSLLKIPTIAFIHSIVFTSAFYLGFLLSMLEIHLRQFGVHGIYVGLVFLGYGIIGAIVSPLACRAVEKYKIGIIVPFFGEVCCLLAFLLFGPSPLLPIQPTLCITLIGIFLLGVGIPQTTSTITILAIKEVQAAGNSVNDVFMKLTAIWFMNLYSGLFLGPIIAGALYDTFGLPNATLLPLAIATLQTVFILVLLISKLCTRQTVPSHYENIPILRAQEL